MYIFKHTTTDGKNYSVVLNKNFLITKYNKRRY